MKTSKVILFAILLIGIFSGTVAFKTSRSTLPKLYKFTTTFGSSGATFVTIFTYSPITNDFQITSTTRLPITYYYIAGGGTFLTFPTAATIGLMDPF